jgi:hypothetical protein
MSTDDDDTLRKAAELIREATGVALSVGNPLSFGQKLLDLLIRASRDEPLPKMPEYFLHWLSDVQQDVRAHDERLFALETDAPRAMVIGNLGEAAWREANAERRCMLGDAVLGVVVSDLTVPELSRAERTIRLLDPEDLSLLVAMNFGIDQRLSHAGIQIITSEEPEQRYQVLRDGHLAGSALVAAGCVTMNSVPELEITDGAWITPLGQLVLRFMGREAPSESVE